jgi:hypothetical protein
LSFAAQWWDKNNPKKTKNGIVQLHARIFTKTTVSLNLILNVKGTLNFWKGNVLGIV